MARTAQVQRDAKIGEAEAQKDAGIKVVLLHSVQGYEFVLFFFNILTATF